MDGGKPEIMVRKKTATVGDYGVVVCGGGPAGFIAAIAAARNGVRTAIIERYGFPGGMATVGFVNPISVFTYKGQQVVGGIPWEFIGRLQESGGAMVEKPLGNVAFEPEHYKLISQKMLLEAGVDLYMHSYLSGCLMEGRNIAYAVVENKNGSEAIKGKVFIDCTGDADLAAMAGVPMQESEGQPLQPLSSYFVLGGVDTDSPMIREAMHHNKQGENCQCMPVREKLLAMKDELGTPEFGGPWFCTTLQPGVITVNITRKAGDACSNRDYTAAECRLREDVFKMAAILKENFEEFRNSYIIAVSVQAGIRESRRIKGVHTVTGEEYLKSYHYADSIARGAHPVDVHIAGGAAQSLTFLESPAYVPYRALIAGDVDNLIVAGRCLSADKRAFAALRVQASCMDMGQAAGTAAALCAADGTRVQDVDMAALISRLRGMGSTI